MDNANTTNVEFIVDPKVSFHGWLIYSYLQVSKLIKCKAPPGECADWFFDNIMTWSENWEFIDCAVFMTRWSYCLHTAYRPYSILKNEHALNREPVPLTKSDFEQNNLVSSQKRYPRAPLRDKNAEEKRNLEGVPFFRPENSSRTFLAGCHQF